MVKINSNRLSVKIKPSNFWVVLLITFTIYSFRIGTFGIPFCWILFFLTLVWIVITRKASYSYLSAISMISIEAWCVLGVWGTCSLLWIDKTGNELNNIFYDYFIALVVFIFSIYTLKSKVLQKIYLYFCVLSIPIAVMGWITAFTGYYFNATYESYFHTLNFLGLHRPNTIFYNVNDHAVFMFFSLIILFLFTETNKHRMFIRAGGLWLYGANILFVDSRGVELAIIVFIILYYIKSKRMKWLYKIFLLLIGVGFLCICYEDLLSLSIFNEGVNDKGRLLIWLVSLRNLSESFFLGVGPGNISISNAADGIIAVTDCHNFFLEILCDYGIIGGITILIWYISMLSTAWKYTKIDNKATIIWCALLSFIVISIVSSSLIGKNWFAGVVGILIAQLSQLEKSRNVIVN